MSGTLKEKKKKKLFSLDYNREKERNVGFKERERRVNMSINGIFWSINFKNIYENVEADLGLWATSETELFGGNSQKTLLQISADFRDTYLIQDTLEINTTIS